MSFALSHGGLIAFTAFFFEICSWFVRFRPAFLPKTFVEQAMSEMFDEGNRDPVTSTNVVQKEVTEGFYWPERRISPIT